MPIFILAFVVGSLFRLADQYDIAVLRMFGTQGIVVIDIWGARIVRGLQVEAGVGTLRQALGTYLAEGRAREVAKVGSHPVWLIEAPAGEILLGVSEVAESTRKGRARRLLLRDALRVWEAAARSGAVRAGSEVRQGLVLVRRSVRGPKGEEEVSLDGRRIALFNPETLSEWLRPGAATSVPS